MTQLSQQQSQQGIWMVLGPPTACAVQVAQPLVVTYADGSTDSLPAHVPALTQGGTTQVDRTSAVWVAYVQKGDPTLRIVPEQQLAALSADYAPLARLLADRVVPYQPQQPSGAAIKSGAWSGGAVLSSARSWQGGASVAGLGWHANAGAQADIGASVTETGLYLLVPSAPASDMTLFDWDLGGSGYFRCKLTSALHIVLESDVQGTSSSIDSAVILDPGGWYWVSAMNESYHGTSGWFPNIQIWAPGGVTPGSQQGAQTGFVPGEGHAFDTTGTFAVGVSLTSSYLNFPNAVGWGCSKAMVLRDFGVGARAGSQINPPSSDPSGGDALYMARQSVGAATTLLDTSGNSHDMSAGGSGLTIVAVGPYP